MFFILPNILPHAGRNRTGGFTLVPDESALELDSDIVKLELSVRLRQHWRLPHHQRSILRRSVRRGVVPLHAAIV